MMDFGKQLRPVNSASPVELRGCDLPRITQLARRAGLHREVLAQFDGGSSE